MAFTVRRAFAGLAITFSAGAVVLLAVGLFGATAPAPTNPRAEADRSAVLRLGHDFDAAAAMLLDSAASTDRFTATRLGVLARRQEHPARAVVLTLEANTLLRASTDHAAAVRHLRAALAEFELIAFPEDQARSVRAAVLQAQAAWRKGDDAKGIRR